MQAAKVGTEVRFADKVVDMIVLGIILVLEFSHGNIDQLRIGSCTVSSRKGPRQRLLKLVLGSTK